MPTVRFDDQDSEGESVTGGSKEVTRAASNIALADHIGKFVAGEVSHKFNSENLADRLKGRNAIHVSVSWG